ncbi:MAG: ABC transporter permease, partial [Pseudomonadota bacterium]
MRLELVRRAAPSGVMRAFSPLFAVALTMGAGAAVFSALGYDGPGAVAEIFVRPVTTPAIWQDLGIKAAPLILIALGLSVGFRAGVWNIGAEGQYVLGGLGATGVALATWELDGPWILPLMVLAGAAAGMAWAAVPAVLRVRLGVNEILTSLMLTYVAVQLLNYLMRGPWQDPEGFSFPETRLFSAYQMLPTVPGTDFVHWGVPIAFLAALLMWGVMARTVFGFSIRVVGEAPRAAVHAGFGAKRTVWAAMLISGGFAGLAGALEAAGPFGQMVPQFPTGYGFTAIIVAFLGRLHPIGIVFAALVLAVTYVGGEMAQSGLGLPAAAAGVFQAMMLFFLLGVDVLVRYRV